MKLNFVIQLSLLITLVLHDWMPLPPLNNIKELAVHHSVINRLMITIINSSFSIAAIILTYFSYMNENTWLSLSVIAIYSLFLFGAIWTWWKPYFFGCSEKHKQGLIEYKNTHHFLPTIGNNPTPNTLHVILHIQILLCLGLFTLF